MKIQFHEEWYVSTRKRNWEIHHAVKDSRPEAYKSFDNLMKALVRPFADYRPRFDLERLPSAENLRDCHHSFRQAEAQIAAAYTTPLSLQDALQVDFVIDIGQHHTAPMGAYRIACDHLSFMRQEPMKEGDRWIWHGEQYFVTLPFAATHTFNWLVQESAVEDSDCWRAIIDARDVVLTPQSWVRANFPALGLPEVAENAPLNPRSSVL